jgi:osmoprotectant transport system permease protein
VSILAHGAAGGGPASRVLAQTEAPDPWFDLGYLQDNTDAVLAATRQHVVLTLVSVALGLVLSLPLALLARRVGWLRGPLVGATGVLYTIPSLALFAVLAPVTGLTGTTVVIGLTAYTLLVLVRNVLAGLDGVPDDVREAARGTGMSDAQVLVRVDLPLALPSVLAGLRVATVSTVALTTVGVVVSNGGLGQLILEGFNNNLYRAQILTGTVLCVLLALAADALLLGLERLLTPWARARPSR